MLINVLFHVIDVKPGLGEISTQQADDEATTVTTKENISFYNKKNPLLLFSGLSIGTLSLSSALPANKRKNIKGSGLPGILPGFLISVRCFSHHKLMQLFQPKRSSL